jgi:hypothetical protein
MLKQGTELSKMSRIGLESVSKEEGIEYLDFTEDIRSLKSYSSNSW